MSPQARNAKGNVNSVPLSVWRAGVVDRAAASGWPRLVHQRRMSMISP